MTKADYIRQLARWGLSDKEILAKAIKKFGFCNPSYVRTCARQRVNGKQSDADARYYASDLGRAAMKRFAIKRAPAMAAWKDAFYHTGSYEEARKAYRKVREEAAHA